MSLCLVFFEFVRGVGGDGINSMSLCYIYYFFIFFEFINYKLNDSSKLSSTAPSRSQTDIIFLI